MVRSIVALLCVGLGQLACSERSSTLGADGGAFDVEIPADAIIHIDAPCTVTVEAPPVLPAYHVAVGTQIDWDSNPPSSGPHYPIWAAFQAYSTPVPRGYYVHDLEHGAIDFLYQCNDGGGCPDVVAALQTASDSIPTDPLCMPYGTRVRTVITPDPLIGSPIAAAAWGWVYTADCVDMPSLTAFANLHYGQGPEMLCATGQTTF